MMVMQRKQKAFRVKTITFVYLESEEAHPPRQLEEDAVLDSVSPHLGVQHGDQAGQRCCATAHSYKSCDQMNQNEYLKTFY